MSDVVIRAEGLGKRYRIRHQRRERYTSLRDVIADRTKRLFAGKAVAADGPAPVEDFWALRDVSFEVKRGEVLGIIGRNGAGKSTLLKILSRITEPTIGRVTLDGRVASLLEVGTGFHPELTGRENISLNGAILGMSGAEIAHKFDEIVDFAGVERFLDTPVKHYSSGMYVRLAFAVAAHLEPEILVVDEVLAVGDAAFQEKCIARVREVVSSETSAVLFVSHNLALIRTLCTEGLLLEDGRTRATGEIGRVCDLYSHSVASSWSRRKPVVNFGFVEVWAGSEHNATATPFGKPLRIYCRATLPPRRSFITFIIKTSAGVPVAEIYDTEFNPSGLAKDAALVEVVIDNPNLLPGKYTMDAWLGEGLHERIEYLVDCCSFEIGGTEDVVTATQLALGPSGAVYLKSRWRGTTKPCPEIEVTTDHAAR